MYRVLCNFIDISITIGICTFPSICINLYYYNNIRVIKALRLGNNNFFLLIMEGNILLDRAQ